MKPPEGRNMKYLLTVLTLLAPAAASAADSIHCYSIQDSDRRNECLALAQNNSTACYGIKNSDRRNYCLARSKKSSLQCYSINDADLRSLCLAETK